jgi:hypothetical protein
LLSPCNVFQFAQASRIYCWDCEDPFLSEEESINVHRPKIAIGSGGEEVSLQTGPIHRFHPLVEEDCAICKHRHERYEMGLLVRFLIAVRACVAFMLARHFTTVQQLPA